MCHFHQTGTKSDRTDFVDICRAARWTQLTDQHSQKQKNDKQLNVAGCVVINQKEKHNSCLGFVQIDISFVPMRQQHFYLIIRF